MKIAFFALPNNNQPSKLTSEYSSFFKIINTQQPKLQEKY